MKKQTLRKHHRTCTLCEAMCGIVLETEGDKVIRIQGDQLDPFSRGHICPKAPALQAIHDDPDRLRNPKIKTDKGWRDASWAEALAVAAQGIHNLQQKYGNNAMGVYLGNPNVHNMGAMLFGPQLVRALKTRNRFSATSADQLPHMFASYLMFGHQLLVPIPDIDHTDYFVIIGGNPLASNGSLMTVADVKNRLKAIQARNGEVVVVDPRRTETAKLADKHHFIQPETDAVLLLALLNTLFSENLVNPGAAAKYSDGLEKLKEAAQVFTAEQAEPITGIPATEIRALAGKLAQTPQAALYGRMGASTQSFGGLCHWLINSINILCGNFDVSGGVMFTTPAVDGIGAAGAFALGKGSVGRWQSAVRGLPEFGGELPVAALAEDMLDTPEEHKIRGLLTMAGNPVLSTPNGDRLDKALAQAEFVVSIDIYLNETTRHADVLLPPVSPLERAHYDLAFHLLAVRNTAKYSPPTFAKPAGSKDDWQIALELMTHLEKLRGRRDLKQRVKTAALHRMGPEGLLSLALLAGPYGLAGKHKLNPLTLGKLKRNPHGVDLGPLKPQMPGRLQNKRKRIDLTPQPMLDDLARLQKLVTAERDRPFLLIGRRHLRNNNSWMHNAPGLMTGKDRCTLQISPRDAETLGFADGQTATITSSSGTVQAPVEITDDLMPGVVSLPHGFGHNKPGVQLQIAREHAGVSINDLTDHRRIDALTGNAAFNGTPVDLCPS